MGRGRAKAKQTKVARELKYSSPSTDLRRLQDELATDGNDEDEVLASHPEWSDVAGDPFREDEWRRA